MTVTLRLASASGNVFGFLAAAQVPASFVGPRWAQQLCPKGDGLGLDGLFLVETRAPGLPWRMTHWDPDGGETFCSNGTRAAAVLLDPWHRGDLAILCSGEAVQLRVGAEVGLRLPSGPEYRLSRPPIELDRPWIYGWTGTPHLILEVPCVDELDLPECAPALRHHPALPGGANVTFLEVISPGKAKIRSWERGVEGETLCCGQGASVAGAWLTQRTGLDTWSLQPRGRDAVRTEAHLGEEGCWRELWLAGPVRDLGELKLGPGLDLT